MKSKPETEGHFILTDTCILVPSWDGYQDLWQPFFRCIFKYWPDCPFQIYLGANHAVYDDPRVKMLTVAPKTDYSSSLIEFLNQLPHTWIIVWVEDLLLRSKIDTNTINQILLWANVRDAAHVRLLGGSQSLVALAASYYPQPEMPGIGMIPKGAKYRAGLTVGLWKKEALLALLQPGESAWDFEHNGTLRSNAIADPFFCVVSQDGDVPLISVENSVRKGLWTAEGVEFLNYEGLSGEIGIRKKESRFLSAFVRIRQSIKLTIFRVWYSVRYRKNGGT